MKRRMNNTSAYQVCIPSERDSNRCYLFYVILTRIKNNIYGNPRYQAKLVKLNTDDIHEVIPVYRFDGHYYEERGEAFWIAKQYIKEVENNER